MSELEGGPLPAASITAPAFEAAGIVIQGVSDLTVIETTGLATIFQGYEPDSARSVMVKVLDVYGDYNLDADTLRRYRLELRAMAALSQHPAFITLYRHGFLYREGKEVPYIVTEYASGGSLGERLDRSGPLTDAEVAAIGTTIADALAVAHGMGIVHGDIRPLNILQDKGRMLLSGFDLAQFLEEDLGVPDHGPRIGFLGCNYSPAG